MATKGGHISWSPETTARIQILENEIIKLKEELKKDKNNALIKSMHEKEMRKKDVEIEECKKKLNELLKVSNNKEDKFYKEKYQEEKERVEMLVKNVEQLEEERDSLLKRRYQVEDLIAENLDLRNEITSLNNRQDFQAENYLKQLEKVNKNRELELKQYNDKVLEIKSKYEKAISDLVAQLKSMQTSVKQFKEEKENLEKQCNIDTAKVKSTREKLDEAYVLLNTKDENMKKLRTEISNLHEELETHKQLKHRLENLQKRYDKISSEIEKLREHKLDTDYILANKDKVISALEKQIKDSENDLKNTSNIVSKKLDDRMEDLKQLKHENEVLKNEIKEKNQNMVQNVQQVEDLKYKIENYEKEMEKALVQNATNQKSKENEILQLQKSLADAKQFNENEEIQLKNEIKELKSQLQTTKEAIEEYENKVRDEESKVIIEKLQNELVEAKQIIENKEIQLQKDQETIENQKANFKQNIKLKEDEIVELKEKLKEIKVNGEKQEFNLKKEIEELHGNLEESRNENELLRSQTENNANVEEMEKLQKELEEIKKIMQLKENQDQNKLDNEQLINFEENTNKSQKQIEDMDAKINEYKKLVEDLNAQNEGLQKELNKKQQKFNKLVQENEKLNENLDEALTDKIEAEQTVKKKDKELLKLREMLRESHETIDEQNLLTNNEEIIKLQDYINTLKTKNQNQKEMCLDQQKDFEELQAKLADAQVTIKNHEEYANNLKRLLFEQEEQIQELQELMESEKIAAGEKEAQDVVRELEGQGSKQPKVLINDEENQIEINDDNTNQKTNQGLSRQNGNH